jgi:hypothetical protein
MAEKIRFALANLAGVFEPRAIFVVVDLAPDSLGKYRMYASRESGRCEYYG